MARCCAPMPSRAPRMSSTPAPVRPGELPNHHDGYPAVVAKAKAPASWKRWCPGQTGPSPGRHQTDCRPAPPQARLNTTVRMAKTSKPRQSAKAPLCLCRKQAPGRFSITSWRHAPSRPVAGLSKSTTSQEQSWPHETATRRGAKRWIAQLASPVPSWKPQQVHPGWRSQTADPAEKSTWPMWLAPLQPDLCLRRPRHTSPGNAAHRPGP